MEWEPDDDDLEEDSALEEGPTFSEQCAEMARSGDIDGLWQRLTDDSLSHHDVEAMFRWLLQANEVRCRQDSAQFAADNINRMLSFTASLLYRAQYCGLKMLSVDERGRPRHGRGEFPPRFAEEVLPTLLLLQRHVADLSLVQVTFARQRQLARQKQIANGRNEKEASQEYGFPEDKPNFKFLTEPREDLPCTLTRDDVLVVERVTPVRQVREVDHAGDDQPPHHRGTREEVAADPAADRGRGDSAAPARNGHGEMGPGPARLGDPLPRG